MGWTGQTHQVRRQTHRPIRVKMTSLALSLSLTFHERLSLREEVAEEERVMSPARDRVVALDRRDEVARDELRALRG